jgi:sulfopyruvate decarboxylase TPP-binding subunit
MRRVTSDSGLLEELVSEGHDFFTGVPDSGLKRFLADMSGLPPEQHVPATWEAEAVGIAAGAALAGRRPVVYLQNAGLGHAVNPLSSLCIPYGIELTLVPRPPAHAAPAPRDGRDRCAASRAARLGRLRARRG